MLCRAFLSFFFLRLYRNPYSHSTLSASGNLDINLYFQIITRFVCLFVCAMKTKKEKKNLQGLWFDNANKKSEKRKENYLTNMQTVFKVIFLFIAHKQAVFFFFLHWFEGCCWFLFCLWRSATSALPLFLRYLPSSFVASTPSGVAVSRVTYIRDSGWQRVQSGEPW